MAQGKKTKIALPKYVHAVKSRGRIYYYFQRERRSKTPGPRHRLPNDPQSPEFYQKINEINGIPQLTVGPRDLTA